MSGSTYCAKHDALDYRDRSGCLLNKWFVQGADSSGRRGRVALPVSRFFDNVDDLLRFPVLPLLSARASAAHEDLLVIGNVSLFNEKIEEGLQR